VGRGKKAECDYRAEKKEKERKRDRDKEKEREGGGGRRMGRIGEAAERIVLNYHPLHIPDFS